MKIKHNKEVNETDGDILFMFSINIMKIIDFKYIGN